MHWVTLISAVVLVAGALLTVSLLYRRAWVLTWRDYRVQVRGGLLRVVMRIDGDLVAEAWHLPGRVAALHALLDDPQLGMITFRASVTTRWGLPSCQLYINGDRMGGDRLRRRQPRARRTRQLKPRGE